MEPFGQSLVRSIRSIGPSDVVDIVMVAALTYCVLRLLRTAVSRTLIGLVVALTLIYFVARSFDLFLTEIVLRTGAVAALVVCAIAFQDDLRRAVLRLRGWRPRGRPTAVSEVSQLDTLAEIAFLCAAERTGALVVLRGKEPLAPHLEGGISLTAPINTVLLQSIFDPGSPGHDGAIVVEDGQISRMCAHLPLSTNHLEIGNRGTRHSAGLGLSEVCDATCIIVSEERGNVSLARDGKLIHVASPAELKRHLEEIIAQDARPAGKTKMLDRLVHASGLKIACILLALLGWLVLASHADILERTYDVPIEFRDIPPDLRLAESIPRSVRVMLSGPEPAFALLNPSDLKVSLDLHDGTAGQAEIPLEGRDVVHPPDLSVYRVEPQLLHVELEAAQQPISAP